jgi:3-hydroxyisobutyrate dehydrogenase-like beta-hydroxyacid dehydrogenase
MTKVAVLGLGAMGSRMTKKLLEAGHELFIYNRTPDNAESLETLGAIRAGTPKEAAAQADVVISMVSDDEASREVWLARETGAVQGLRPGSIAIESSTLSLQWINRLNNVITQTKSEFIDAPVAGSRPQAEAGQLVYFVGGSVQALDQAREVLSSMAAAIYYLGPSGSGMLMKLAVNALLGVQVAAFGEILGLVEKRGMEAGRAVEILGELPTTSAALKLIAGQMVQKNYSPQFPIKLVEKDFRYIGDAAERVDAETPISKLVRNIFMHAKHEGFGEDNISAVAQLYT